MGQLCRKPVTEKTFNCDAGKRFLQVAKGAGVGDSHTG